MIGRAYTLNEIAAITHGELHPSAEKDADLIRLIAFDSRDIHHPETTLFIAITTPHRDGHAYIADVWARGVRNFWISDPAAMQLPANYLVSADTLAALQSFAAHHRRQYQVPVIGITGSNGKTIVKEWLTSVLEPYYTIVKSPKSFNSSIGIPLSLLQIHENAHWALIEVGISRAGEMHHRAQMVNPDFGILTHLGDAHAEGFPSHQEKVREKMKLFAESEVYVYVPEVTIEKTTAQPDVIRSKCFKGQAAWASEPIFSAEAHRIKGGWDIRTFWPAENEEEMVEFHLPVQGEAALENALIVIGAAHAICKLTPGQIKPGISTLFPVSMRTEMITDNPEITVISDAYNADASSIHNAFNLLASEMSQPHRMLILSDLEHQGTHQHKVQAAVLREAVQRFGAGQVILVGPVFLSLDKDEAIQAYRSTDELISAFDYEKFRQHTVLIKGARAYSLERIIPHLTRRATATHFRINMNALASNFRYFRSLLPRPTRIVAMVKAFSYGSGTWEIAHRLEQEGVDYLAVAYTVEGIALRTRGIRTPILVLSPDDASIDQLLHFQLEPEIFHTGFLLRYLHAGKLAGAKSLPLHLKVDTGMGRLGFHWQQTGELIQILSAHRELKVLSVMSHLSSADEPDQDHRTHEQVRKFLAFYEGIAEATHTKPLRHILNTAGSLRFPQYTFEMVRLGIGLYGMNPAPGVPTDLEEIGSLHSLITQIHEHPPGTYIGYGASQTTTRDSRIATVPIGYADGIRRALGNGTMSFLVRGMRAPTFGRICMDMLMLDVTDVPGAREGDEVVLMGRQGHEFISANEIAAKCGTISYEILAGISGRVQRLYDRE